MGDLRRNARDNDILFSLNKADNVVAVRPAAAPMLAQSPSKPECISEAEYLANPSAWIKLEGPFSALFNCQNWVEDFCGYWSIPCLFAIPVVGSGDYEGVNSTLYASRQGNTLRGVVSFDCNPSAVFHYSQTCDPVNYEFTYEGEVSCANQATKSVVPSSPTKYPLFYEGAPLLSDPIEAGPGNLGFSISYGDISGCLPVDHSCPGGVIQLTYPEGDCPPPSSSSSSAPGGSSSSSSSSPNCSDGLDRSLLTVADANPDLAGYCYAEDPQNGWAAASFEPVEFMYRSLGSDGLPYATDVYIGGTAVATINFSPNYIGESFAVSYRGQTYCGSVAEADIQI